MLQYSMARPEPVAVVSIQGASVAFGFVLLAMIVNVAADKHLSADGVFFFTRVVDSGWFGGISWSRIHAEYSVEWPLVLAVRAGVVNLGVLSAVYGAGICLPYVLSFMLCLYAVRGEHSGLLVFPAASMAMVNLASDYILVGEHHVLALVTWPILLLLLRRAPWTAGDCVLLVVLLCAYMRLYDASCVPATVLAACAAYRALTAPPGFQRGAAAVACALCLYATMLSVYFCAAPRDEANRAAFLQGVRYSLGSLENRACALFTALYAAAVAMRSPWFRHAATLTVAAYAVAGVCFGVHAGSSVSFASRTLVATLLPVMMLGAIAAWRTGVCRMIGRDALVVVFVAVLAAGSVRNCYVWRGFAHEVKGIVASRSGYVRIEDTPLPGHPCGWTWNNGLLGLVWSDREVHALILDSRGTHWLPFDLRFERPLARYRDYCLFDKNNRPVVP